MADIDMKAAFFATIQEAVSRGFAEIDFEDRDGNTTDLGYAHVIDMYNRWDTECGLNEAKQGRWLGWLQGILCAHQILTLAECKDINTEFKL